MGPSFVAVAGEAIDLTKIDVTGYDPEEGTEGEVYVQGLDALGRGTGSYYYYDVPGELVGWLDGSDNEVEEGQVMIPAGDALWVSAPSSAYSLVYSGQVPTEGIEVSLRGGFKLVANVTPVPVDLTAIDVTGYDPEEGTEGEVYVQGLDSLGRGTGSYYYYDVPEELVGWLDGSDNEVEEGQVMIPAGDALWVSAPSSAYSIIVPGVTL